MGYHVPASWIIRLPLAPTARWVLVCMNDMGWPCWPSIDKLSKLTGIPRRSLERVLGMLRKGGVLKASGHGKALTWELVEPPAEVVPSRDNKKRTYATVAHQVRHRGASPAPPWRTRCATMAHGSEPENEPEKEPGVRRLVERPATPPEADPPGTEYVSMAEVLAGTRWKINPGDAPPAGGRGRPAPGTEQAKVAQARLEALRAGRLRA